ncbi:glycerophosphoryl diester phosphodiesterase [Breoghania corrubedonensis]|uniref:Glycerophosphoryl diester phosphodiesterase n=1 Tax=Breoghania corrubedonensis TaxID=665038 RepID=A0A2T5VCK4_9HYPH|nr:glycerophosphodiester phosphodiesterase family protein [Breoghania corrubedonensis]PTW61478.1 glycerophosphoryl diester phosphodiesterase [Breoghania corrubedonensis]
MPAPEWLTARPIAHRGLHDASAGRIENTPSAVAAAAGRGYAIEVDLQETSDHGALVFHDNTLDRLTGETGPVRARALADLMQIPMRDGGDSLWDLDALLGLVAGRVPLVIELKSLNARDGQRAFVKDVTERLARYDGPVALKTFDPEMLANIRALAPQIPRGILAENTRTDEWRRHFGLMERFILRHMMHWPRTRPDFISYGVRSLPAPVPWLMRRLFRVPVMTWTVRTAEDRAIAARHADQIVFEGFDPDRL